MKLKKFMLTVAFIGFGVPAMAANLAGTVEIAKDMAMRVASDGQYGLPVVSQDEQGVYTAHVMSIACAEAAYPVINPRDGRGPFPVVGITNLTVHDIADAVEVTTSSLRLVSILPAYDGCNEYGTYWNGTP